MTTMDRKINELLAILKKQEWTAIEFETTGYISAKFILHKPKYSFPKNKQIIKLGDNKTDKQVTIDIYAAVELEINEEMQEYEILLDNYQYIKLNII